MPADPIEISASSYGNRAYARRGSLYALQVRLTLPGSTNPAHAGSHKPINTTDYALLVTVPTGGAVTYKRAAVSPKPKPRSLARPTVQSSGNLLWPRVPMPLYWQKQSTRTFKVRGR